MGYPILGPHLGSILKVFGLILAPCWGQVGAILGHLGTSAGTGWAGGANSGQLGSDRSTQVNSSGSLVLPGALLSSPELPRDFPRGPGLFPALAFPGIPWASPSSHGLSQTRTSGESKKSENLAPGDSMASTRFESKSCIFISRSMLFRDKTMINIEIMF